MDIERRAKKRRSGLTRFLSGMLLISCTLLLVRSYQPTTLEQILMDGELRVISRNGPTTYFEGPNGLTGFEYTLVKGFADELGVDLVIKDEDNISDILRQVSRGTHHLAAAAITATPKRSKKVTFTRSFTQVKQQLIFNSRKPTPASTNDLMGMDIVVVAQSSHAERLRELREIYPELSWRELDDVEMIDLMEMVQAGEADVAIVDSNSYDLNRYAYPRVSVAFDISEPQQLAWAFPHSNDSSLYDAAQQYLSRVHADGTLEQIYASFFQPMPIEEVTTGDALMFTHRLEHRFPSWEEDLRGAAEKFELDWELLAAISYQESHWDPKATSHTGVRGLMMLTLAAASEVGVVDRVDPKQSIYGGAQYFKNLLGRIPARVTDPNDRLYMALAAYNVGLGHLEDARVLTQKHGDDPNKWSDVRKYLPLLSKQQYYTQTKHGYARGWEPVHYVKNVRNYRKILQWYSVQEERRLAVAQHDSRLAKNQVKLENTSTLSRNNLNTSALSVL
jgi:membrane-bound lytic murein transglycosylase F